MYLRDQEFPDLHRSNQASATSCDRPLGQGPQNTQAIQRYRSEYDHHRDFLVNGPGSAAATTPTAGCHRHQSNSALCLIPSHQRSKHQPRLSPASADAALEGPKI